MNTDAMMKTLPCTELFNAETARFGDRLDNPAPAREYLVEGFLPHGITSMLAADSGIGKSYIAMQLALSVVTGSPFFGHHVQQGSVVVLSGEDDMLEQTRRIQRATQELSKDEVTFDPSNIKKSLYIIDVTNDSIRLYDSSRESGSVATKHYHAFKKMLSSIPNLKLVILDTYSRLMGFEEQHSGHTTEQMRLIEFLRAETGCTVLMIHHTHKNPRGHHHDTRGSSAIAACVRWMAQLTKNKNSSEHPEFKLKVTKSNYSRHEIIDLLQLDDGLFKLNPSPSESSVTSLEELSEIIVRYVDDCTQNGETPTRTSLKRRAGIKKEFKASEQAVLDAIDLAIENKKLVDVPRKGLKIPTQHEKPV